MRVVAFSDQYRAIADLYGMTSAELETRDRSHPRQRWFVLDGSTPLAAATAVSRPDDRTFLAFVGDVTGYGPLVGTVADELAEDLYTTVAETDPSRDAVLRGAGFETEVTTERFEIRFETARAALSRFRVPVGFACEPAGDVDEEQLFSLDNAIRNLVPGLDGWQGNREWFRAELTDPAAYQVAIDLGTGTYAGLARMWRNPNGAHFGLVGVDAAYRRLRLGPALLNRVIREAAQWGHRTFTADAALTNRLVHPRLLGLGATSLGKTTQLVLRR
ncbi:MAG: GNAT family N-acetyltransferase [Acidimicrobiales bacterium]